VSTAPVANLTHVVDATYSGLRWALLGMELLRLPGHWRAFDRALSNHRAEIVHLNESTLVFAALAARRRHRPLVWHVRHVLGPGRRRVLVQRVIRRWADCVIAIDRDVRLCLGTQPRAEVVHNSVDLTVFRPNGNRHAVRQELGVPADVVCVAQIGRLGARKGSFDFIEAVRLLPPAARSQARFLLVGGSLPPPAFFQTRQGRMLERLGLRENSQEVARRMVEEYGLTGCVQFVDFWRDMPSLYSAMDVIVFPSRLGGIGRPGFEAAACGDPVVATTVTGNSEVVVDGVTGTLVPAAEPAALADALARLIESEELRTRMGTAGLEHARRNFDMTANGKTIMAVYDRVLTGKP
nr:glycosyltransferase [Actinomycetota bacterium]